MKKKNDGPRKEDVIEVRRKGEELRKVEGTRDKNKRDGYIKKRKQFAKQDRSMYKE